MLKLTDLTKRTDQNIWISDDRISALISHSCQGIEQIDFHGAQPVSRNAKLLHHADGVLKFEISIESDDSISKIPFNGSDLMIQPGGIVVRHRWGGFSFNSKIAVLKDTLFATCTAKKNDSSSPFEKIDQYCKRRGS